jgi:hypothetical protein
MNVLVVAAGVALICFILYALDRRVRKEPIAWDTAAKLSLVGGGMAGSLVYFLGPETVSAVTQPVVDALPSAVQDMFVGQPTF